MAEQILHGSNVVTAAEQGRRERVAEGVRCGGLRDACLFYGALLQIVGGDKLIIPFC
ncbi:hypothetical protein AM420_005482 [Klebsiella pneumoniae]|jgi:hypothetical protein|nr:hypothetical protein [Salmonella sp.]OKN43434.1 hypothetical protein AM420_005482 [Klebsiella pneumoniae]QEQ69236.1 hypothetical protein [Enterobacter cloacae]QID22320.1 hypothetical protein [Escherichia coli]QJR99926.1 hypothetical protein [Vibrio cholerae]QLG00696.1 hypothetical protein [Leclercia adecarboxylata]QTD29546.1 hypothetical protein ICJKHHIM_00011 [Escherichia coli str. K-12 substr. MG1655]GEH43053.1 hypothetical protein EC141115_05124 [Escherichia coli O145:H28]